MSAVEALRLQQESYQPSPTTSQSIADTTLIVAAGPFATGKSGIMQRAAGLDSSFGRVRSITTRPRRSNETDEAYEFRSPTEEAMDKLLAAVHDGEAVQYTIAPFNDHYYGSHAAAYTHPYMMIDVLGESRDMLQRVAFKKVVQTCFALEPDAWERTSRRRRRQVSPAELRGRLQEGRDSLAQSLEMGSLVSWIHNPFGDMDSAAKQLIQIGRQEFVETKAARHIGERLLRHLTQLTS